MSIRHAILGVLLDGPMHGYQIGAELTACIGGGQYNSAQIYTGLRALADRGLVIEDAAAAAGHRDRRPYRITPAGEREFASWLQRPPAPLRPVRDETLVKLALLGRHAPSRLPALLDRLRRQHLRRLTGSERRPAAERTRDLVTELTAAALRYRVEAELHWIDYCLTQLRERGTDPGAAALAAERPAPAAGKAHRR
jgi:DNA-binding PadR family transcriptional regulator